MPTANNKDFSNDDETQSLPAGVDLEAATTSDPKDILHPNPYNKALRQQQNKEGAGVKQEGRRPNICSSVDAYEDQDQQIESISMIMRSNRVKVIFHLKSE